MVTATSQAAGSGAAVLLSRNVPGPVPDPHDEPIRDVPDSARITSRIASLTRISATRLPFELRRPASSLATRSVPQRAGGGGSSQLPAAALGSLDGRSTGH